MPRHREVTRATGLRNRVGHRRGMPEPARPARRTVRAAAIRTARPVPGVPRWAPRPGRRDSAGPALRMASRSTELGARAARHRASRHRQLREQRLRRARWARAAARRARPGPVRPGQVRHTRIRPAPAAGVPVVGPGAAGGPGDLLGCESCRGILQSSCVARRTDPFLSRPPPGSPEPLRSAGRTGWSVTAARSRRCASRDRRRRRGPTSRRGAAAERRSHRWRAPLTARKGRRSPWRRATPVVECRATRAAGCRATPVVGCRATPVVGCAATPVVACRATRAAGCGAPPAPGTKRARERRATTRGGCPGACPHRAIRPPSSGGARRLAPPNSRRPRRRTAHWPPSGRLRSRRWCRRSPSAGWACGWSGVPPPAMTTPGHSARADRPVRSGRVRSWCLLALSPQTTSSTSLGPGQAADPTPRESRWLATMPTAARRQCEVTTGADRGGTADAGADLRGRCA